MDGLADHPRIDPRARSPTLALAAHTFVRRCLRREALRPVAIATRNRRAATRPRPSRTPPGPAGQCRWDQPRCSGPLAAANQLEVRQLVTDDLGADGPARQRRRHLRSRRPTLPATTEHPSGARYRTVCRGATPTSLVTDDRTCGLHRVAPGDGRPHTHVGDLRWGRARPLRPRQGSLQASTALLRRFVPGFALAALDP